MGEHFNLFSTKESYIQVYNNLSAACYGPDRKMGGENLNKTTANGWLQAVLNESLAIMLVLALVLGK